MANKNGIQRAVEMFGGSPTRLAEAIGSGVLRQHIEHWLKSGRVPSEKAPEVAAATGIDIKELNNTTNWALAGKLVASKCRRRTVVKPAADSSGQAGEASNPTTQSLAQEVSHG